MGIAQNPFRRYQSHLRLAALTRAVARLRSGGRSDKISYVVLCWPARRARWPAKYASAKYRYNETPIKPGVATQPGILTHLSSRQRGRSIGRASTRIDFADDLALFHTSTIAKGSTQTCAKPDLNRNTALPSQWWDFLTSCTLTRNEGETMTEEKWAEPSNLIVEQIEIGPMQNFTYVIGCRRTHEVVIVDPAWDVTNLVEHINNKGYNLTAALATHYHPDHVGGSFGNNEVEGVAKLMEINPVKVHAHKLEVPGLKKVTALSDSDIVSVESGDTLKVGDIEIEFLHTPGHTPGSQCFRVKNTLISGDTLFINGCGRVDLPGSNSEDMYHSMCKLCGLPDDTLLLPGHNYGHVPNATMGETKQMNTYLRIDNIDTWKTIMGG
tara:strand:- start:3058 stop:4203 length:1146 start_codon:yes stop_codon:yes gene_type:complete